MSLIIETLNRGEVSNFGFVFDSTRIRLGDDLPPMSVPQFCQYAADALIDICQTSNPGVREKILESVLLIGSEMEGKKIRRFRTPRCFPGIDSEKVGEVDLPGGGEPIEIRKTSLPQDIFTTPWTQEKVEDFMAALSDSIGATIRNYESTPFIPKGDYVNIAKMYDVPTEQFSYFVLHILRGGFMGWGDAGIPDCAFKNIKRLQSLIEQNQ